MVHHVQDGCIRDTTRLFMFTFLYYIYVMYLYHQLNFLLIFACIKLYNMKNKKKITSSKETVTIDHETGEVLTTTQEKNSIVESEPPFVKVYVNDISRLNDLSPATNKVLNLLVRSMGYKGIVAAYMPVKKMIAKDLDISINTINKAISEMHKKGILIRKDKGLYIADPSLFGRGKWEDIRKIRLIVSYDENGRKVISEKYDEDLKLL